MTEHSAPIQALIQEELSRLMDSDALRRAPSHARLLRYLVEKRVAGDDAALRETSIALEVFRRDPSSYDPRSDPIVRVTTGRLRDRLETHYARYDKAPKLRILLPKGRYAPEFVAHSAALAAPLGLAVLRTRNQSGDETLDGCCAEFADQLADRLTRAGFPRIIARGSVDSAEALTGDTRALGVRLDVPWLLDSTVSRDNKHELRLSVRLVHTPDAGVRWVETALGHDDDIYGLIDRMLDAITLRTLETLPAGSAPQVAAEARQSLPVPQRAALERARLLLLQRTVSGTDEAIALAEGVTAAHGEAAEAWATLAAAQYSRMTFQDEKAAALIPRLRETADHALALDPDQPVALRTMAMIVGKCDYDAVEAEQLFLRAVRLMPHYTSARLNYAELLTLCGRNDEALVQLNLARLYDPLSGTVHLARAVCLGYQRRYAEARDAWALCRAAGEGSVWALVGYGMNELAAGDLDAAAPLLIEALERFPDIPAVLVSHAALHAARGDHERASAIEREYEARYPFYSPSHRALVPALRRDRESTLRLLDEALSIRDMDLIPGTMHPAFDWLADDLAYNALRNRCPIWARRPDPA